MLLEGKGLAKTFGGLKAVDDLDIEIRSGEVLGLIGPNGAGKTTVLNLFSGSLPLTRGRILVDGIDISRYPTHKRSQMGIIRTFQLNSLLWQYSVVENLEAAFYSQNQRIMFWETLGRNSWMGKNIKPKDKALSVLKTLGISDLKDRIVNDLPYGQQRMVAIGIALMVDPRILLLDEPAAGLNWDETVNMLQVVKDTVSNEQVGVLLVEHNVPAVLKFASRVVAMSFGRKLDDGPPEQVMRNEKVVEAYLGREEATPC